MSTVRTVQCPGRSALARVAGWRGTASTPRRGTPAAVVERLNADANAVVGEPAVAARLAELGAEPTPGSPAAFQAFTLAELAKWREVARAANVKLD